MLIYLMSNLVSVLSLSPYDIWRLVSMPHAVGNIVGLPLDLQSTQICQIGNFQALCNFLLKQSMLFLLEPQIIRTVFPYNSEIKKYSGHFWLRKKIMLYLPFTEYTFQSYLASQATKYLCIPHNTREYHSPYVQATENIDRVSVHSSASITYLCCFKFNIHQKH